MPFAQYGAPHTRQADFEDHFPADYICEAIDQTRGWFYSMLAVSTLLFDESSYRNVVCLGHLLDETARRCRSPVATWSSPGTCWTPTAPTPSAGTCSRRNTRGTATASASGRSGSRSPASCCRVEHLLVLRPLRQREWRCSRLGAREQPRERAPLRPRPLGPVAAGRHRRDGHRRPGELRRHRRRPRDLRLHRGAVELVRAPLATPLLATATRPPSPRCTRSW